MDLETVIPGRISQMLITLRTTSSTKFQSAIHLYFMSQNGPIAKEWYLTRISIALAIKFVEHGLVSVVAHFKIHVLVEQLTTLPKLARLLVCVLTSKPQTVNFSWTSQEAIPKPIAPRPMNATRCGIGDSSTICSTVCSFCCCIAFCHWTNNGYTHCLVPNLHRGQMISPIWTNHHDTRHLALWCFSCPPYIKLQKWDLKFTYLSIIT